MYKRSLLLGLAACVTAAVLGASQANAASTPVFTDSGSLGSFTATNTGIVGGVATIHFALTSPASENLTAVNGVALGTPIGATFTNFDINFTTVSAGVYTLSSTSFLKTFGAPAPVAAAELTYTFAGGTAVAPITNFLNLTGFVTGVLVNNLPGFDFTPFAGGGDHNFALTGTNFSGAGVHSFANLITHVGGSARGNGSYSEAAFATPIPEPASVSMFGIGILGLIAYRRRSKKALAV